MTKSKISNIFTGILVACAIIITGFVIRQQLFPPDPKLDVRIVKDWQKLELKGWNTGPLDAPVKIIEFYDYECPFCKRVQPAINTIKQKYPKEVTVVYVHKPLSNHSYAFEAAVAVECAGEQYSFNSFHNLLFTKQDSIQTITFSDLAQEAGVPNIERFNKCIKSRKTVEIVQSGLELADELDINSIPTFIINGKLVSGALSLQQLENIVQEALGEAN